MISDIATLTVNSIKGKFNNLIICEGSSAILTLDSLTITGSVVAYQWQKSISGSYQNLLNETNNSLSISESGSYRCRILFRIDDKNTCPENTPIATATVRPVPPILSVNEVNYCQNQTSKALTATPARGNLLAWYDSLTAIKALSQNPVPKTDSVGQFSYFVSQRNQFGCESPRAEIVVNINSIPKLPVTNPEISYCRNAPSEPLEATTEPQNTLKWYTLFSTGIASTVAPKPNTGADTTLTYYVSAVNTSGCESSLVPIKVTVLPCIASLSDDCIEVATNDVSGNRWFDIYDANGYLYASVNPNGQNLGKVTLRIKKYPDVPISANGTRILQRFTDFQSSISNVFDKPVSIRIYHTNTEFDTYKSLNNQPNLTINDFKIIHYDGIREDCDWFNDDNFEEGQAFLLYQNIAAKQIATDFFYLQFDVDSFSEIATTSNPMTEVANFRVQKNEQNTVDLDWTTTLEVRALKFKIQRSKDGKKWTNIAEVQAQGTPKSYNLTDYLPLTGKSFYRIVYMDKDGVQKILQSKEITFEIPEPICRILPNPVVNEEDIKLYLGNIQPKEIKLYNQKGQEWGLEISIDELDLIKIIPNSPLNQGIYYIKITDGDKNCIQRFSVIK